MKRPQLKNVNNSYDIAIVGGGITGCAVAYEAISNGYSVLLLEKEDFGHATSSATSKLIHGGLRYLKNYEFGLVRESLQERRILGNITPNLVRPLPFVIPNYKGDSTLLLKVGMQLYDLLSYDKSWVNDTDNAVPKFSSISAEKLMAQEPKVKQENLTGGVLYYDYQNINPDRMTFAFLNSAIELGAVAMNYAEVIDFTKTDDTITGIEIQDLIHGEKRTINSKIVVNCSGPWADKTLNLATKSTEKHQITRSEGIHIITKALVKDHAIALQTEEIGHIMYLPWRGHTIIGTTDHKYEGNPDDYKVSKKGIDVLLEVTNKHFGNEGFKLGYDDILHVYGGLRPLTGTETEDSYKASRKYDITDGKEMGISGFITVEGGKYTTSRHLAENVLKLVHKKLGTNQKASTKKKPLKGCRLKNHESLVKSLEHKYGELFTTETFNYYAINYGELASDVLDLAKTNPELQLKVSHDGEILAEVQYVLENEMAMTILDVLLRRTAIGTLGKPSENILNTILDLMQKHHNWSQEKKEEQEQLVEQYYTLPI